MPTGVAVEPARQPSAWVCEQEHLVIGGACDGACMSPGWFHTSCREDYGGAAELGGWMNRVSPLVLSNSGDSSGNHWKALGWGEDDLAGRASAW